MINVILNNCICIWILMLPMTILYFSEMEMARKVIFFISVFIGLFMNSNIKILYLNRIFIIVLFSVIYVFWGAFNSYNDWAIQEGTALLYTIIEVVFIITMDLKGILKVRKIQKAIIATMYLWFFCNAILLISLLPFDIMGGVKELIVLRYLENNPNFTLALSGFMGELPRLDNGANLFPYLVMFYVISTGRDTVLLWVIALLSCIIGNGRLTTAVFIILIIYALYIRISARMIFHKYNGLNNLAIYSIMFVFLLFFLLYLSNVEIASFIEYFSDRYGGGLAEKSDNVRLDLIEDLIEMIENNFVFGVGLGGFIPNQIRDANHYWNMELMPLALYMQLGLLGFVFIAANFAGYYMKIIFTFIDKERIVPFILSISLWFLGASLQGNLLIGNFPGCILGCLYLLSLCSHCNVKIKKQI